MLLVLGEDVEDVLEGNKTNKTKQKLPVVVLSPSPSLSVYFNWYIASIHAARLRAGRWEGETDERFPMPACRDDVHPDIGEILLTSQEIAARTAELGKQIASDYSDKAPLVVSTLKGSVLFFADLVRCLLPVPDGLRLEFVRAKSYHGQDTETSGTVDVRMSTVEEEDVRGRHVLLVRAAWTLRSFSIAHLRGFVFLPTRVYGNTMPVAACSSSRAPSASVAYSIWQGASAPCPADNRASTHGCDSTLTNDVHYCPGYTPTYSDMLICCSVVLLIC
jgi:hypothetical protein